jgi:hypothetical protein
MKYRIVKRSSGWVVQKRELGPSPWVSVGTWGLHLFAAVHLVILRERQRAKPKP